MNCTYVGIMIDLKAGQVATMESLILIRDVGREITSKYALSEKAL